MQSAALMCVFYGPTHVFKFVNPPYQALVGDRPLLGKHIAEAMPELAGQPIFDLLDRVYRTGEPFHAPEMLVRLDHVNSGDSLGENYYNFVYQALRDPSGQITGILVFAYEVTAQVQARQREQQLNRVLEEQVRQRTRETEEARQEAVREREHLERVFMQAPGAICILEGPLLVYRLVNPTYQQIFPGRTLLDKPLLEALPELTQSQVPEILARVYRTGETYVNAELPLLLARHEGDAPDQMYFSFTYQARRNGLGEVDGVLVFAHEVTEQARGRQAAEDSARQLRMVTDALPVLIGYLDQQETYRFANKAYESWFPLKSGELLGRRVTDVVGEQAYGKVKEYLHRALAGERVDFEATMPYREGFTRHIRTSYVPDERDGEVLGCYTLVTDVTAQVEAHRKLQESDQRNQSLARELQESNGSLVESNAKLGRLNDQLRHINADLDNFIYAASHDLRNPILNIEGLLGVLEENLASAGQGTKDTHRVMGMLRGAVGRFKQTIGQLAEVTKLQKESAEVVRPAELAPIISGLELDLAFDIQRSGARIEVEEPGCPNFPLSEKNLRSIVYNLLSNAIKYRSPERPPHIRLGCRRDRDIWTLSVRDNL
nr:PAS domain-containing sensor histidine kinase [Rufibacter sediminis]